LFASFPSEKIVLGKKVVLDSSVDNSEGWFVVAGNAKPCQGNRACGDGGLATKATLAYPKVNYI
jgi:hypothetical protein